MGEVGTGEVGTPENLHSTYEKAVHNRRGRTDLVLHAGRNIPTEVNANLSQAPGPTLECLWKAAEEPKLPLLPHGVLPGG